MADPGRVGAAVEQQLGGVALAAVGGAPQRVVELLARGRRGCGELVADAVGEAERGGLPEVGARAAFQQPAGGVPLAEGDGVGHRGAAGDHGAVGLDVGAGVEQRVERLDVVAAGRPVQRRLAVRAGEARVDVGARGDQRGDLRGRLGNVARPVGDDVQQRPRLPALGIADPRAGQRGCSRRSCSQRRGVAGADDLGRPARQRAVRVQPRRVGGQLVLGPASAAARAAGRRRRARRRGWGSPACARSARRGP